MYFVLRMYFVHGISPTFAALIMIKVLFVRHVADSFQMSNNFIDHADLRKVYVCDGEYYNRKMDFQHIRIKLEASGQKCK